MTDSEKFAREAAAEAIKNSWSLNAGDPFFNVVKIIAKEGWDAGAAYRDALPAARCEHGVIKVDHCYSCDASQAKASLYDFSCCGGNDDPLKDSKPGDHDYYEKAHTMDCDEHPGVTPPQAKASADSAITRLESLAQLNVCEVCESVDRDLFLKNGECIGCDRCLDDDDVTLPQATEASAEFDQADIALKIKAEGWPDINPMYHIARHAFAKGRENCDDCSAILSERNRLLHQLRDSVSNEWVRKNTVSMAVHEDLQAKLLEAHENIDVRNQREWDWMFKVDAANAEIERLKSQINTHK